MQCISLLTDSSVHHSQHWRTSSSLFWSPLRRLCFGKLLLLILDLKMSKIPHQLLTCHTPYPGLVWHCLSQPSRLSWQVFSCRRAVWEGWCDWIPRLLITPVPRQQGISWEKVHICLSSSEAVWEDLMRYLLFSRRCCTQAKCPVVDKWMSKCVWIVSPVVQSHCGKPNYGAQGCDFRAGGGYFFSNYLSQKSTVQVSHCAFRWEYKPSNCPGVTHSQFAIWSNAKSHSHSLSLPLSRVMQLVDLCYSLLKKNSNFAHF